MLAGDSVLEFRETLKLTSFACAAAELWLEMFDWFPAAVLVAAGLLPGIPTPKPSTPATAI